MAAHYSGKDFLERCGGTTKVTQRYKANVQLNVVLEFLLQKYKDCALFNKSAEYLCKRRRNWSSI